VRTNEPNNKGHKPFYAEILVTDISSSVCWTSVITWSEGEKSRKTIEIVVDEIEDEDG
jgi:hypothetical protein